MLMLCIILNTGMTDSIHFLSLDIDNIVISLLVWSELNCVPAFPPTIGTIREKGRMTQLPMTGSTSQ